jgi:hypothetical protein
MSDTRRVFLFSFHEHDWMGEVDNEDDGTQMMLQMAATGEWVEHERQGAPTADYYSEFKSEFALSQIARAWIVDGYELPEEVAKLPFDKLSVLMAEGGWEFVSGSFNEFVGNNTDTEIYAVLRKK